MKDNSSNVKLASHIGLHGHPPALQVICLASGGGPSEDNVTGFLVRSIGSEWAKGSLLAVDAGSHLAPITRMLEQDFPRFSGEKERSFSNGRTSRSLSPSAPSVAPVKPQFTILDSGAFAGLKFPNASARANALHVLRTYISTYLITHPHLDHVSGFAINTAAFHATSRPKTLAALPSTVNAIKNHLFNDLIWPNLTDEDGGVGFVTFQRLKEGGDLMMGEGEGRGYVDVCDGIGAKAFKVSHGNCTKSPPSHHHRGSITGLSDTQPMYNGSIQGSSQDHGPFARSMSISHQAAVFNTPNHASPPVKATEPTCVVDSTAFFLRDEYTQREVLIFGDVEPDTISLSPRNHTVWLEAARKIVHGLLGGIFIECSYDDSQPDALLFGHLCPRHLIAELSNLAQFVLDIKQSLENEKMTKKRKRSGPNGLDNFARNVLMEHDHKRTKSVAPRTFTLDDRRRSNVLQDYSMPDVAVQFRTPPLGDKTDQHDFFTADGANNSHGIDAAASPKTVSFSPETSGDVSQQLQHQHHISITGDTETSSSTTWPLSGIKVIIIHIKDTLKDGPPVSENILAELQEYDARLQEDGEGLGCEFVISQSGESYWF